ncbi:hypothetical protein [Chryseobacterium sp.]|uniref:hypothetical protein n=1 Tax=Chryseobacterium sp. TaxID=1871047 RepID=UPI0025BDFBEE|nr:hypothetical protein [Chryseobacterium sp.]
MKPKKKAVIFDMYGTLVDNICFHEESWLLFLEKNSIGIDLGNFQAQNHGTIDEMISCFF